MYSYVLFYVKRRNEKDEKRSEVIFIKGVIMLAASQLELTTFVIAIALSTPSFLFLAYHHHQDCRLVPVAGSFGALCRVK